MNCLALARDKHVLAVGGNPAVKIFDTLIATKGPADGTPHSTANIAPLHTFEGHAGNVVSVGFQVDRRWLWSGSEDGTVRIWDLRSHEHGCQREISVGTAVTSVALHARQTELFIADRSGRIRAWELAANACVSEAVVEDGLPVQSISLSGDGRHLAAVDQKGSAYLWRVARPVSASADDLAVRLVHCLPLCKIQAHQSYATRCLFSPDSAVLLTTSADHTARLWRVNDPAFYHHSTSQQSLEDASPLQPSSPAHRLGSDPSLLASDAPTLAPASVLEGHVKWVWDCAFSADSAYVVTVSSDNSARLWDAQTGETIAIYTGHSKAVTCIVLNDLPS